MNLIESSEKLFSKALTLMKAKNHDYAGKDKAVGLENFNITASVANISREQGILVRLMDKMTRVGNLLQHGAEVKTESINDTLEDAINYCAILHYALNEKKE